MNGRSVAIPTFSGNQESGSPLEKIIPYLLQWAGWGLVWPVAALAHNMWSDPGVLPWIAAAMAVVAAIVTYATWQAVNSRQQLQLHATITVAVGAAWLTAATIAGPTTSPVLDLWLLGGPAVVLTWNIRRLTGKGQVNRGEGGTDGLTKAVKAIKAVREIEASPNKVVAQLEAATGSSADDIVNSRGKMAAALGVGANGVRVRPNPEDHSNAIATVVPRDMLKKPTPWPGPTAPGGCITESLTLGLYEDGVPVQLWLPGDPVVGRNATHLMLMGMSGSGKTHCAKELWTELLTRRNCSLWLADAAKGLQSIGFVAPHADWANATLDGSMALVDQLMTIITARTNQLADEGLDQWTPESSMPYMVVWIEEAARAVRDSDALVDVAQTARSAGVSLVLSLQRPDMDNIPVQVRQQFGAVACFGVKNIKDALFVLSEDLVEQGADPSVWGNKKPGYFYMDAPGIPEDRATTPARTFDRADADMLEWVQVGAKWRPGPGPVTAKAAGEIFTKRTLFVVDDRGRTVPADTTPAPAEPGTAAESRDEDEDVPTPGRRNVDQEPYDPPENHEPDLDDVDPDKELPPVAGSDDLDFSQAKPTLTEARAALAARLADIQASGAETVSPKDIGEEFFETVRSRPWVSAAMSKLAMTGDLVETSREGIYRFRAPVPVA